MFFVLCTSPFLTFVSACRWLSVTPGLSGSLQLVGMSKYMGLNHFGTDALLRFQLRNKVRQIKADDQMILWEGVDSLTPEELRNACAERGMRATGLSHVRIGLGRYSPLLVCLPLVL